MEFRHIDFSDPSVVRVLDQRRLPTKETYIECRTAEDMARAIEDMVLRGAPLIGIGAAMGVAVEFLNHRWRNTTKRHQHFVSVVKRMSKTRPTAVNLFWALERMQEHYTVFGECSDVEIGQILREVALNILEEDIAMNRAMGLAGSKLFEANDSVLTHCNAGALATGGYGTALGVIRSVAEQGKNIRVFVDETRPYLQGTRLTAWELQKSNIPVTLISDNMAGHCIQKGLIQRVIVGSDRIARNGDIANKIGTYSLSVLAKEHNIPFYVAAPSTTVDLNCPSGAHIPIEERQADEVTHHGGQRMAPEGIDVYNPAFDITPAENITAIITENGVWYPPYEPAIVGTLGHRETNVQAV